MTDEGLIALSNGVATGLATALATAFSDVAVAWLSNQSALLVTTNVLTRRPAAGRWWRR